MNPRFLSISISLLFSLSYQIDKEPQRPDKRFLVPQNRSPMCGEKRWVVTHGQADCRHRPHRLPSRSPRRRRHPLSRRRPGRYAQRFGPDLAKPAAGARLGSLRSQRSFVPPVWIEPDVFGRFAGALRTDPRRAPRGHPTRGDCPHTSPGPAMRYPTPRSLKIHSGLAASSPSFLRMVLTKMRTRLASSPLRRPQTRRSRVS